MQLPTQLLKEMFDRTLEVERSNLMLLTGVFRSYQDPDLEIDEIVIESLFISQEYRQSTTDDIHIKVRVFPLDLMKLMKHQSDLYLSITVEYFDEDTGEIDIEEDTEVYEYRVFIHDLENIAKKYGINQFANTEPDIGEDIVKESHSTDLSLDVQLIEEEAYTFNRGSFHGILTECTIGDAVRFIAAQMGVKKINMVEPDNQVKYRHIIIPPEYAECHKLFNYLQWYYGVYAGGLTTYFTGGVLYVFPPYDLTSERPPKLTVLKAAPQSYIGLSNYHDIDDENNLTFVCNTNASHQSLSNITTENEGNARVLTRSDLMIDGQVNFDKMKLTDTAVVISNNYDNSIKQRSTVVRYKEPTINFFDHASRIAEGNAEMLVFAWNYCRLFRIVPGMATDYVFDEEETVMLQQGLIEGTSYMLDRKATKNDKYCYACTVTITLRSESDVQNYDP